MTGFGISRMACRRAITRVFVCALLSLGIAPAGLRAATVLYDFTSPPNDQNLTTGVFAYNLPNAPAATFEGLQYDDTGIFPDHTTGAGGAVFGAGQGVTGLITFSAPVDLVELFVNNAAGSDFDGRPGEFQLFNVTAFLGATQVFSYDRAAESAPGTGVASDFLRIAPATPVTIDSISLSNFDQDTLDDLKVNVVPEPAAPLACAAGALAVALARGRRTRRCEGKSRRGGHAPERDPPRADCGGRFIIDTQSNAAACAASELFFRPVSAETAGTGICT
jgi:hypothetical protein